MKVNILKFDHFGRGIGKINEKIVFVDKALPGEIVDVKITKTKKNYSEAKIDKILEESIERIDSICPYYDKCGGCSFLHTNYDLEKEFKIEKAKELLGKIDNFYETKEINYRNKITLHVKNNKLGLYEEHSNEIVNINYCYLLNDNLNKVIKDLNTIDLSNYNINRIIIKTNQNKILLDIDSDIDDLFIDKFDYVDTIISNKKIVKGNGYIEEIIDKKVFKITSEAFFQVNIEGLNNIYHVIKDFLKDKKINNSLDLYSGSSLWGILVSDYVKSVTSVEINKEACDCAKDNIKKNNINNIQVINGDVSNYIDLFTNIDLVIIDPPRSGLDTKTREYLKKINSKYMIYVSCDMKTLQRDLEDLKENYNIISTNLIDMFKRTYHCESIEILERK